LNKVFYPRFINQLVKTERVLEIDKLEHDFFTNPHDISKFCNVCSFVLIIEAREKVEVEIYFVDISIMLLFAKQKAK
jgi:hypothetical protein